MKNRTLKITGKLKVILSLIMIWFIYFNPPAYSAPIKTTDFNNSMRKLWEDHITWTRLYIVSAVADLPDKDATTNRLLQNQTDIGNAIKPFYGNQAGEKLTSLLRDHILVAASLIDAAKAGDKAKQDMETKKWFDNADQIATFLSSANPKNWPLKDAKIMMHDHLNVTTSEVVAHLQKKWPEDVAAYDKVHLQILSMADMLSKGIIRQFPSKFRKA
jgi:hypothetical protein